jgi:cytochrome P450
MMAATELPQLDLQSQEFIDDPFGYTMQPQFSEGLARSVRGLELVSYDAVAEAIRNPNLRNPTAKKMELLGLTEGPAYDALTSMLTSTEGADHRRMRRAVAPWFNAETVEVFRGDVRSWINEWIDEAGSGTVNFADTLALSLPAKVFCQIVGAPVDQMDFIARVSIDLIAIGRFDPGAHAVMESSAKEAVQWVRDLVDHKRKSPGDDIVSAMLQAEARDELSLQDIVDVTVTLLIGSVDSTRSQMSLDLVALAGAKDQWRALNQNPDKVGNAVSELVRFSPAVMTLSRQAIEPMEFRGVSMTAGDLLFMCTFAANNDPTVFHRPRELDVLAVRDRAPFTFGNGRHSCLGRVVATLEQEELLRCITERWEDFDVLESKFTGAPFVLTPESLVLNVKTVG